MLRGLFEPFAADLSAALSFNIEQVVACFAGLHELADQSFQRFRVAGREIGSQPAMDAHFATLGEYLSFNAADVAAVSGTDVSSVRAILDAFSLDRGAPDVHALIPSPFSILREKPVLRAGDDRFIVPSHALLFPAIQPRIEEMLNASLNPAAAVGLWNRYQDHRGRWVEEEAYRLIRGMIPGGTGVIGGYYHVTLNDPVEGSIRHQVESDVTYKIDDVLFLIEGKAGSFSPSTFRGGAGSVSSDVKEIITKGHEQCARTEAFVRAGNRILENNRGTPVFTIPDPIREIFRLVVTLDNSGVLATATVLMQRAGYMPGDPTWTLSLTDLMILSETLQRPGEMRHYARRRYESMLHEHVLLFDETDPLGMYLRHNDTTIMYGEADTVMLNGYSDSLDDYYVREVTVRPPSLEIPDEISAVIRSLAEYGAPLWTEAVCDLFALGATLKTVAVEISKRIDTKSPRDFTFGIEGGAVLTFLIMPLADPEALLAWFIGGVANSANKPTGKRLFIAYDPAGRRAKAEYRQRVNERYFHVPPSITWTSAITSR